MNKPWVILGVNSRPFVLKTIVASASRTADCHAQKGGKLNEIVTGWDFVWLDDRLEQRPLLRDGSLSSDCIYCTHTHHSPMRNHWTRWNESAFFLNSDLTEVTWSMGFMCYNLLFVNHFLLLSRRMICVRRGKWSKFNVKLQKKNIS